MTEDRQEPNRIESLTLSVIFAAISVALLVVIGTATPAWVEPCRLVDPARPGPRCGVGLAGGGKPADSVASLRRSAPQPCKRVGASGGARTLRRLAAPGRVSDLFRALCLGDSASGLRPRIAGLRAVVADAGGPAQPGWMLAGVGLVLALLAIFRIGLGVWMPAPDLYDRAPEMVRTLLIRYF